jgi:hypothetical protein
MSNVTGTISGAPMIRADSSSGSCAVASTRPRAKA